MNALSVVDQARLFLEMCVVCWFGAVCVSIIGDVSDCPGIWANYSECGLCMCVWIVER